MIELQIEVDNNYNLITNNEDLHYLSMKLKVHDVLKCQLIKSRNIKHNGKYWLLLHALEYHFGNSSLAWHEYFKKRFLPKVEFKYKSGKVERFTNSTAFERMNQFQFEDYYNSLGNFLLNNGYSVSQLINTMPRKLNKY